MCQNNRRQYVPENWPVDSVNHSEQTEKADIRFRSAKIAFKVTALHYLEGCFKARQLEHIAKKCWM